MPELPPLELMLDVARTAALPAFAASVGVLALGLLALGKRSGVLVSGLALAAGVAAGNWSRGVFPWLPDYGWEWLPAAALIALAHGLMARAPGVPWYVGLVLRAEAAAVAAWLLLPEEAREEPRWLPYAFGAVILAEWLLLEHLARREPGGSIPAGLALAFAGASLVLIYAHSARLSDVAVLGAAALAGIALVVVFPKSDTGGAVGPAAVLLTGLMLSGRYETFSEVPRSSFLLVALAPLALLPLLALRRLKPAGFLLAQFGLVLVPVVIAVVLAMQSESLEW